MPTTHGRGLLCLPVHRALSTLNNESRTVMSASASSSFSSLTAAKPCLAAGSLVGGKYAATRAVASRNNSSARPQQQRRHIHSSDRRTNTLVEHPGLPPMEPARAPLALLPLSMILRSLATTIVSSSPVLLPPSLRIMAALAHSKNPLFSPDKNPILRYALKNSFYAQFCAGENAVEVRRTVARLKHIGFTGVILGYAKEVVLSEQQAGDVESMKAGIETKEAIENEILPWASGTLETVRLAEPGDYVALKFTGAGRLALHQLAHRLSPTPVLAQSIDSICQLAHERGVRLLFDAEQDILQNGIDDWTMHFARKYNTSADRATIYGTYQAYKKCIAAVLSKHLAEAKEGGFTLGVKLVRGAYLGSDPRETFHDTKEETDVCYDGMAASVLTRQWNTTIQGEGKYPAAHIVLATHNTESVRRARAICDAGGAKSDIAFAQLQGMADEVSCELVDASHSRKEMTASSSSLPVFKYLVWGTTGECMKYLLRRAEENKDAVQRTRSGRDAMLAEVIRRCKSVIGLA